MEADLAQPKPEEPNARLVIHDLARHNGQAEFARDVFDGLSAQPRHLFPKYLYDALGSQLFEAICHVDEYYLTRAEREILTRRADEIVATVPNCRTLIDLGSGSAEKTRKIIEALMRRQREVLLDQEQVRGRDDERVAQQEERPAARQAVGAAHRLPAAFPRT